MHKIQGPWDLGYSLDKHTISSTYKGDNEQGHPQFDTIRTEAGEALFLLKYRFDKSQVDILAEEMVHLVRGCFASIDFILPMPPSKQRVAQPVMQITRQMAAKMGVPCLENMLVKTGKTAQMKDIPVRDDRISALCSAFVVNDVLSDGKYDVLVVDDLYDTGSSLEAATIMLREYGKIRKIFVATVTRKNP